MAERDNQLRKGNAPLELDREYLHVGRTVPPVSSVKGLSIQSVVMPKLWSGPGGYGAATRCMFDWL